MSLSKQSIDQGLAGARSLRQSLGSIAFCIGAVLTTAMAAPAPQQTHVFGNPEVWQWAPSRSYHVENYKLSLRFDQQKGEIFGDEIVTLRPFERDFHSFYLNSSELTIDSVSLQPARGAPVRLAYTAEDPRLWVTLDRDYGPGGALSVRIVYHGFPRTGLFFVNPSPSYPSWPHEVYSQGDPEFNHFWFPCWDYPNDLATSETITTVPEGQRVVSNGRLTRVTRSAGQVTYDWVESVPHSSYLISIAVGPWRKVSDRYEGKPVDYYVPEGVDEATARRSFHLTPDMLQFFSHATGVDYPYEQYAQTTVQNFIFGGQENVSATTLTDQTLHDERADSDYPSTGLVSHELGQHWFGDFVQARDWADIWLNEGFATYLEALYTQHHAGNDAYRYAIYNDQRTEQAQDAADYRRPIVDRHYTDPLQMYDAITHEKGAAVLDMLRYVLDGPRAASRPASQKERLFRALHRYLVEHHAESADTADLIGTLRSSTGEELGWFFHEWVFMGGHPDYRVEAHYNAATRTEKIVIAQTQEIDEVTPVFDMPIELAFYGRNGQRKATQVRDKLKLQEFDIPLDFEPRWIDFDPDGFIDKTVRFDQSPDALAARALEDTSMMSRLSAVQQLGADSSAPPESRLGTLAHVLDNDPFYAVRAAAAAALGTVGTDRARAVLLSALKQPDSRVRTAVVEALGRLSTDDEVETALIDTLHGDASYAVQAAAAREVGKTRETRGFEALRAKASMRPELHVMKATLAGLAASKDPGAVEVLLSLAQPGVPEQIRSSAIEGLATLGAAVAPGQEQRLAEVARAALHDPFFGTQQAAAELIGALHLREFQADLERDARGAAMIMQRESAQKALAQLKGSK